MSATRLFARAASPSRTGAVHTSFKISIVCLMTLAAAGCAATPPAQVAAADPAVRVPAANYRSTIGGYSSLRPVEPLSWREQNERLMPQPKQ